MKICFVANLNSIHTIRWIQPVIDARHEVYVVSYSNYNLPITGAKEIINLTRQTNLGKIRFAQWGMWLRGYVHKIQPDILHAHQIPAAGWMCALTGFHPFIVTGWGSDILIEPNKSTFRRLLTNIVLARTDILTVPSRLMYNVARDLGFPEERLHLIPWGVETNIFKSDCMARIDTRRQLNLSEHTTVIFCPRGVHPIYNLDIVVTAIHSILPHFPDLRLILLKYNPQTNYLKKIEQQIATTQMQANVIWLPAQESPEDMASLYQISDVVLSIPSSEGYGFSVYEAMACGVPTVISDLPVFSNEIQNGIDSIMVPPRDPIKTGEALASILSNPELQKKLAMNGRNISQSLNVSRRVQLVEELYQSLAS